MAQNTDYETNLVGRMVQLLYPDGDGGTDWKKPQGRVSAAYPTGPNGGLTLWLELENDDCVYSLSLAGAKVGDVVMVHTSKGYGEATIRLIGEPALRVSSQLANQPGTRALVRRLMRHLELEGELTPMNVVIDLLASAGVPYQLIMLTDPDPTKAAVDRVFIANGPGSEPDPDLMDAIEQILIKRGEPS